MRDSSSVNRCERSIQPQAPPEIFGAGTSSQPFQPGILLVTDSHISGTRFEGACYLGLGADAGPDSLPPTVTPAQFSIIFSSVV